MAHELRAALGQSSQSRGEGFLCERTCELEAAEVIRRMHVFATQDSAVIGARQPVGEPAQTRTAIERKPHIGNRKFVSQAYYRSEDTRHKVGMFVGIEMSWRHSGRKDFFDLRP